MHYFGPEWHPIPYIVHYFWPGPIGQFGNEYTGIISGLQGISSDDASGCLTSPHGIKGKLKPCQRQAGRFPKMPLYSLFISYSYSPDSGIPYLPLEYSTCPFSVFFWQGWTLAPKQHTVKQHIIAHVLLHFVSQDVALVWLLFFLLLMSTWCVSTTKRFQTCWQRNRTMFVRVLITMTTPPHLCDCVPSHSGLMEVHNKTDEFNPFATFI